MQSMALDVNCGTGADAGSLGPGHCAVEVAMGVEADKVLDMLADTLADTLANTMERL